jgi:hypothetical protein
MWPRELRSGVVEAQVAGLKFNDNLIALVPCQLFEYQMFAVRSRAKGVINEITKDTLYTN